MRRWLVTLLVAIGTAAAASLLSVGAGTPPVAEADVVGVVSLSNGFGPGGSSLTVTFQVQQGPAPCSSLPEFVSIEWNGSEIHSGFFDDPPGVHSHTFPVPDDPPGAYLVSVRDCAGNVLRAPFYVIDPAISVSPTSGPPGTPVTVVGTGFAPNCVAQFHIGSTPMGSVALGPGQQDFTATLNVPHAIAPGDYVITTSTCGFASYDFLVTTSPVVPPTGTSATTSTTSTTTTSTTTSTSTTTTTSTAVATTQPQPPTVTIRPPRQQPTGSTSPTTTSTTVPDTSTSTSSPSSTTSTTVAPGTTTVPPGQDDTPTSPSTPPSTGADPSAAIALEPTSVAPGGQTTVTGRGCDPNTDVILTVDGGPPTATRSDADGNFQVRLPLAELEPGRFPVVAQCGPRLQTSVDVILLSSNGNVAASSGVLALFVLVGCGIWQLRRTVDPL